MAGLDTQDAQDGAVETLGGRKVRDGDANVVKHPAEATLARLPEARTHGTLASISGRVKQPGSRLVSTGGGGKLVSGQRSDDASGASPRRESSTR